MAELQSGKWSTAVMALAVIAVTGWLGWSLGPDAEDNRVDLDGAVGGPFELVDSSGRTVRAADFRGRFVLIFFGYTYCPDVCPMTLMQITRAMEELEQKAPNVVARITPVFISVDPGRDTPDRIAKYLEAFHSSVVGLTGRRAEVRRTATAYAVAFEKGAEDGQGGYLIDHTSNILLMGPDGSYITHFSPRTSAGIMANVIKEAIGG